MPNSPSVRTGGSDQHLLAAIIDSAAQMMISTDQAGVVTLFNRAAELTLGYSSEEVVGKCTPALWHDKDEVVARAHTLSEEEGTTIEPGFRVFTEKPLRCGSEMREWTFIRKDKSTFPAQLTVTCIGNAAGDTVGFLGIIEDISERKRAIDLLKESEAFLDLIYRSLTDYFFVKDEDCRIVRANPAFFSLYPPEMKDRILGFTTVEEYDAEEAASFLTKDREAFENGESTAIERITFPDGAVRTLNTKKIRFEGRDGKRFIVCIARDVTEREELFEELQETNQELEEFTYRTSHDLRSPLISSLSLVEIATSALAEDDHTLASKSLAHIHGNLTQLETLVGDILSLAQSKGMEEESKNVGIRATVESALRKFEHLPEFDTLGIAVDIPEEDTLLTKPQSFRLIVENLISNAIKYQSPDVPNPHVHIASRREDNWLELRFSDNGLGIPKKHQGRVFEMFRRFHTGVAFGSGLGLHMVKRSAGRLGGEIHYEDLGEGSMFTLRLPFNQSRPGGK